MKAESNIKWLIISAVIILIPMVIGMIMMPNLPETIAIHFNMQNKPDGWASVKFVVYALPLIFLAVQVIVFFLLGLVKFSNIPMGRMFYLIGVFIIPFASTLAYIIIYTNMFKK